MSLPESVVRLIGRPRPDGRPPAIVLGISTNGLAFVRSLARQRIAVLMMDERDGRPGMWSRHGTRLWMPSIVDSADAWLAALDAIDAGVDYPDICYRDAAGESPRFAAIVSGRHEISAFGMGPPGLSRQSPRGNAHVRWMAAVAGWRQVVQPVERQRSGTVASLPAVIGSRATLAAASR
jgi:hypothetical protein